MLTQVDYDPEIAKEGFRDRDILTHMREIKVYEFGFEEGGNQKVISIASETEEGALRLFRELAGTVHINTAGWNGYLDYVTPDLLEKMKNKIGQKLLDKHKAFVEFQKKQTQIEAAKLEAEEKAKSEKRRQDDIWVENQKFLEETREHNRRVNALRTEKERKQAELFRESQHADIR